MVSLKVVWQCQHVTIFSPLVPSPLCCVGLNLFGPTYSGLEYDYRGLQRVYQELGKRTEGRRYQQLFEEWLEERRRLRVAECPADCTTKLEPDDIPAGGEQGLWDLLYTIVEDYEKEFAGIFTGLDTLNGVDLTLTSCSRYGGGAGGGSSGNGNNVHFGPSSSTTLETSRSTGY